ncbi:MAG: hypothetical protein K2X99_04715 [Gemmatimonadaceae bacterium]|nr:hypothetical protein [Gemmatimonadaceae bacterium]
MAAAEADMAFMRVSASDVPEFLERERGAAGVPAIVYLEPAVWALSSDERGDGVSEAEAGAIHSAIEALLARFYPACPLILATSIEELTSLDARLRREGAFDRYFRIPAVDPESLGMRIVAALGRENCAPSLATNATRLGMLFARDFATERRRSLAILRLRRLSHRERRRLEFLDVLQVSIHGFAESYHRADQTPEQRRLAAVHEAGHVVAAIVGTDGRNTPECASIVPSALSTGVVVDSLTFHHESGDHLSYAGMRQQAHMHLAGRASEELVFGTSLVTTGACEDLRQATMLAGRAFGQWGFAPAMESPGRSASNLAVALPQSGNYTASTDAHIEALSREFLRIEYAVVHAMLAENRALLEAVSEALLRNGAIDQEGLIELVEDHGTAALRGRLKSREHAALDGPPPPDTRGTVASHAPWPQIHNHVHSGEGDSLDRPARSAAGAPIPGGV